MPRGPPPERLSRRGPPPPTSRGPSSRGPPPPPSFGLEPPRNRSMRSPPNRKMERNGSDYGRRDFMEPQRRERPPSPRRRSRSPVSKQPPRERMRPYSPPPARRSPSPKHSRKSYMPGLAKPPRSKSPKMMQDGDYSSGLKYMENMVVPANLLGDKRNTFGGSGAVDRSTFRGPEAYTSYDQEEIKKIRIFIRRRLNPSDANAMSQMAEDPMNIPSHRSERDEYREPSKSKRLEEHFRPVPKDSHRRKDLSHWEDGSLQRPSASHLRPEPLNPRDGPPPYDMPPRDRYGSPPRKSMHNVSERKHDERLPPRNYDRKPPKDDFRALEDYAAHRLPMDNGRGDFDPRRHSPPPFPKRRDEVLKDDRLGSRLRLDDRRMPPPKPKHELQMYPEPERARRSSPAYVDPYRRSPVDRYRKAVRGHSMSPPRRSGPPPMERLPNMDRRREGPPREERYRSPPLSGPMKRSREGLSSPGDSMMARRGSRGSRGSGPSFRGGPRPSMGSPPLGRFPPRGGGGGGGGFSGQTRRPFGHRK